MQMIFEFNLNTKKRGSSTGEKSRESCEWNNNNTISGISEYINDNYSYELT